MTTVLHVVESYGGGVASALDQYVRATPDLNHHLLRRIRDDFADDGQQARFASVTSLPPSLRAARRAVRRQVALLRPAVVHAHSSFAGVYVRSGRLPGRPRVVYTPHGYSFERRDISRTTRRAFVTAEMLLGAATDTVAACSRRELDLARKVSPRTPALMLPNVVDVVVAPRPRPRLDVPCLVGMGRLGASKDPEFFAAVVEEVRRLAGPVDAVWVGDGPLDWASPLRSAGVHVTGWLPRREGLAVLAGSTVYVNTSAWESGPMALLEAALHDVPILARWLPAFAHAPQEYVAHDVADLAERVVKVVGSADEQARNRDAWRRVFAAHTVGTQRKALRAAYGIAR